MEIEGENNRPGSAGISPVSGSPLTSSCLSSYPALAVLGRAAAGPSLPWLDFHDRPYYILVFKNEKMHIYFAVFHVITPYFTPSLVGHVLYAGGWKCCKWRQTTSSGSGLGRNGPP